MMRKHRSIVFPTPQKCSPKERNLVPKNYVQLKRRKNLFDENETKKNPLQEYLIYEESLSLLF